MTASLPHTFSPWLTHYLIHSLTHWPTLNIYPSGCLLIFWQFSNLSLSVSLFIILNFLFFFKCFFPYFFLILSYFLPFFFFHLFLLNLMLFYLFISCCIQGDGSPAYVWENSKWQMFQGNEGCSEPRIVTGSFIAHAYPDAKIFLIFRHPTERYITCFMTAISFSRP